ncbi:MAG: dihydroorotase family protein [Nitrososphaerota archaeon]|nr:dihydroorotase family protein [Candidatus Bathyarchaeota archaeon]MCX8162707.1 dihydroorotase family protein [Candidatus Bathyarchaeota archaeon]MDW8061677.1 dihydroorotase family protein [Nitrososphaerota archaeon]
MYTVDLRITGGKVYRRGKLTLMDIAVDDGRIVKLGRGSTMPRSDTTLKADGCIILPGVIDVHVHLRDENLSYKETFETGTLSAALGGVTTVLDMPNNDPPTVGKMASKNRMEKAKGRIYVNVGFYSFIPEDLEELRDTIDLGVSGFKLFLTDGYGLNPWNESMLLNAMDVIGEKSSILCVHCEDGRMIRERSSRIAIRDLRDYEMVRGKDVELSAVSYMLGLAGRVESKPNVHLCHITCSESVEMVSEAKAKGLKVSCEVTPHHILLDSSYMDRFGGLAFTLPLLRSSIDSSKLFDYAAAGFVDIVASDHAPHSLDEKICRNPAEVKPGFPCLEIMLPLIFTEIANGRISLDTVVKALCEKPAEIFRIDRRGFIEEGFHADLVILDPKRELTVNPELFVSKAKYSPFHGRRLRGRPTTTIVGGVVVIEDGELAVDKPTGRILRRMEGVLS